MSEFAFEDGSLVPVAAFDLDAVEPPEAAELSPADFSRIRRDAFRNGLDWLAVGAPSAEAIGRRVAVLQYLLRTPYGPRNQRQLASRLGVSLGLVNGLCAKLEADELTTLRAAIEHGAEG